METFELCKKLHELKPDWSPIGVFIIQFKGDRPRVYRDNIRRTCYDWAPEYTLEYLLDKLPNIIDGDFGFGTLALSTRQGQYRNGWLAFYEDDEGCAIDDSLAYAAQTPLNAVLWLTIIMAEKRLI